MSFRRSQRVWAGQLVAENRWQWEGGSNDLAKYEAPLLQAFFVDGARRIRTADLLGAIQPFACASIVIIWLCSKEYARS
jgi:hypothetical protein